MSKKIIDLTGQKFGKLIVIEQCENYVSPSGTKIQWLCKCECGNETKVTTASLRNGRVKSCGKCLKTENLTDKRFGKLTVIEQCEDYIELNGVHRTQWLCKCDCGKETKVIHYRLKYGNSKSCGHCNDIKPGDKFGKLTVIRQYKSRLDSRSKHMSQWLCKCDCGKEKIALDVSLKNGYTKSCGHCNDIEFVDPYDNKKYSSSIRNICLNCGFRYQTIIYRLKQGFNFEEAVKIKSIVRINKIYKVTFNEKYFEGNLKEICEYFGKDYDQVYEFIVYNRTLEWALEHSKNI